MEGQQIPRNEVGQEEYHNIPHESMGSPSKVNINRVRQELPILFRAIRTDRNEFPVGRFTEMSVIRKIRDLTGIVADKAMMITPNDILVEFPLGSPVNEIAQVLHHIEEWEDSAIETHCMMGDKKFMLKICRDQVEYEERKRQMVMDEERRREEELNRNDQLQHLIEQVNEQARMVGDLQMQNQQQLQGVVMPGSSGSAPRIPSSLHTPTRVYGVPRINSENSVKASM